MDEEITLKPRPKRKITKPCLDYSQVLLREEEEALKKALYVSLKDTNSSSPEKERMTNMLESAERPAGSENSFTDTVEQSRIYKEDRADDSLSKDTIPHPSSCGRMIELAKTLGDPACLDGSSAGQHSTISKRGGKHNSPSSRYSKLSELGTASMDDVAKSPVSKRGRKKGSTFKGSKIDLSCRKKTDNASISADKQENIAFVDKQAVAKRGRKKGPIPSRYKINDLDKSATVPAFQGPSIAKRGRKRPTPLQNDPKPLSFDSEITDNLDKMPPAAKRGRKRGSSLSKYTKLGSQGINIANSSVCLENILVDKKPTVSRRGRKKGYPSFRATRPGNKALDDMKRYDWLENSKQPQVTKRGRKRGASKSASRGRGNWRKKIVLQNCNKIGPFEFAYRSVEPTGQSKGARVADYSNDQFAWDVKERLTASLGNSANMSSPQRKFGKQLDEATQDADDSAKKRMQAQRKFAHSQPCSPNSLMIQQMGLPVPERPKTEDFIKFLCLRGTPNLPKHLEYLNNPLIPASPLTSDEEEFLPVSPFFKRQSESCSKLKKENNEFRFQSCSTVSSRDKSDRNPEGRLLSPRNLTKLLNEADQTEPKTVRSSAAADFALLKRNIHDQYCSNIKTTSQSDHAESFPEPSTSSLLSKGFGKSDAEAVTQAGFQNENEKASLNTPSEDGSNIMNTSTGVEDKVFTPIDLSDSSSQESPNEKQSRKRKGSSDTQKGRKLQKTKNKDLIEGNIFERKLNVAPIFRPMEQEFKNPIKYIKKIIPFVLKFGICTVIPPVGWQASSNIGDDLRFSTRIQHVHKMADRNSKSARYLKYLKRCLGDKSDLQDFAPQIGSCEVDLQQMSQIFASVGGVAKVNTPKKWQKVADKLHLPKNAQGKINKLQDIYYKHVLPFDMLEKEEKEKLKLDVDQKIAHGHEDRSADSLQTDFKGKSTSISVFHRMALNAQEMYAKGQTDLHSLENEFWEIVEEGDKHVAAVSGEIDTSRCTSTSSAPKSRSGWNLSTLPQSQGSILKYLGTVPGLTTSSLKFSSVFSCSEWQKTQDDLFSVEYLHTGAKKVWYAVPSYYEKSFVTQRKERSEEKMLNSPFSFSCPVTRAVQSEGHFIVCLPRVGYCRDSPVVRSLNPCAKVYQSTFTTGYCLTESCCFAPVEWLFDRFCAETKLITPSCSFPIEKIILNFAKNEIEKPKKLELLSLLAEMIKVTRNSFKESMDGLTKAGVNKPDVSSRDEHQGKKKRATMNWEVCSLCTKPCYPIEVRQGKHRYCADHAIARINEEKTDPLLFKVITHLDESELENLALKMEECVQSTSEAKEMT